MTYYVSKMSLLLKQIFFYVCNIYANCSILKNPISINNTPFQKYKILLDKHCFSSKKKISTRSDFSHQHQKIVWCLIFRNLCPSNNLALLLTQLTSFLNKHQAPVPVITYSINVLCYKHKVCTLVLSI